MSDPEGFADHELPGAPTRVMPRTIGARPAEPAGPPWAPAPTPAHRPIGRPGQPGSGASAAAAGPPTLPPTAAAPDRPNDPAVRPRRSPWAAVVAVVLVLAALGAAVAAAIHFDDEPAGLAADATPASAIEGFCANPQPLADVDVPAFQPGAAAVAYIPLPQPSSSTRPADAVTVQVAPEVGDPTLDLEASAALVSVGVCVEETGTETGTGTCDYEITTEGSLGEQATVDLEQTTYRIRAYGLADADVLASGTLASANDRCPDQAFVDGKTVANPLSTEEVLAWVAFNLPR